MTERTIAQTNREAVETAKAAIDEQSQYPAIEAGDITVRFGDHAVLDIPSLKVARGEVLAVMGPNGAGKSTLLLCLALLRQPTTGGVRIAGQTVLWGDDLLGLRRQMAVVFQEPLLLDTTVQENVAVGLRLRGQKGTKVLQTVGLWLDRFGIAHLARQQARSLSGGEAQRTSLARAFALGPRVLFMDEPFAALDPPTRATLMGELRDILRETGVTTFVITHDRDEAISMGDRVGVLIAGQMRQVGTAEEIFSSPADAEVAAFVGVETVAYGVVVGQEEGIANVLVGGTRHSASDGTHQGGQIVEVVSPFEVGTIVTLCLRPEDVTLIRTIEEDQISSARNCLRGLVERIAPLGAQVRVVVNCGFPVVALVTRRSMSELDLSVGQAVSVSFKASAAHLIRH